MIDTTHRFQGHGSLRFVYTRGNTVRGIHISLKYIVNTRRSTFRVAVVVSRKVHKSAVVRNRIRRRLYEIIRRAGPDITAPYDLVLSVYNAQVAEMPSVELEETILHQLEKAGIIMPTPVQ